MSKSMDRLVLERAVELLRVGWCNAAWARDAEGLPADWYSKKATHFCAESAIRRATQEMLGARKQRIAERIIRSFDENKESPYTLLCWNEELGKRAVLLKMCNRLREL